MPKEVFPCFDQTACVAQESMIYYEWAFDQNAINLLNNHIIILLAMKKKDFIAQRGRNTCLLSSSFILGL